MPPLSGAAVRGGTEMSNEMIPDVQLEDNSSQRLPLVIIVDGSTSMSGKPIAELNAGLQALEEELKSDAIARLRVQLMILRVGGNDDVEVLTDWTDAINFSRPMVIANGNTPLGELSPKVGDGLICQAAAVAV